MLKALTPFEEDEAQRFVAQTFENQRRILKELSPERRVTRLTSSMRLDPASFSELVSHLESDPAAFTLAVLSVILEDAELEGWRRDQLVNGFDRALDDYFGLNVAEVENSITDLTPSRYGPAAWSQAEPDSGWLTNYSDFHFLLSSLELPEGAKILDIGSGHGRTGFIVGLLHPQLRYAGFEIVAARAQIAIEIARRFEFSNVTFACADIAALPSWPEADVYYLYDALNEETIRDILNRIVSHAPQGWRLVVRDGKGIALGVLSRDRRFKLVNQIEGDERLYQKLSVFTNR